MKKGLWILVVLCFVLLLPACTNTKESNATTEEKVETYEIKTPYVNLEYPEKWKNQIRTEATKKGIKFFGNTKDLRKEAFLFKIEFEKSEGYKLGTIDDTDIFIVDQEPDFSDDWTEDDKQEILDMKEDVNVILESLMEMDKFTLAK